MRTTLLTLMCGMCAATTAQTFPLTPLTEATPLSENYAINFAADQTYTHGSRHLNGIALNSPSEGYQSADISASSKVYNVVSPSSLWQNQAKRLRPHSSFPAIG